MSADVERVKAQRAAFIEGVNYKCCNEPFCSSCTQRSLTAANECARRYPMPTVEVPRVVVDSQGCKWRVVDGRVEWCEGSI